MSEVMMTRQRAEWAATRIRKALVTKEIDQDEFFEILDGLGYFGAIYYDEQGRVKMAALAELQQVALASAINAYVEFRATW